MSQILSGGGSVRSPLTTRDDDAAAATETASVIKKMSDIELDKEFEKMLDNMNLTDERKEPLRKLSLIKKRDMLMMHYKTTSPRVGM